MNLKNKVKMTSRAALPKAWALGIPLMAIAVPQVAQAQDQVRSPVAAATTESARPPSQELQLKFKERLEALSALYTEAKSDKKARATLGNYVDTNLNFASDCVLQAGYPDLIDKDKGYLSNGVYSAMNSSEAPRLCQHWIEQGFKGAICSVEYIFRPKASYTELKQRSGQLQVEADLVEQASDPRAMPLRVPVRAFYSCRLATTVPSSHGGSITTPLGRHEVLFSFDSTLEVVSPFELQQYTNGTTAKTAMAYVSPVGPRIMELMDWAKPLAVPLIDRKPQINAR